MATASSGFLPEATLHNFLIPDEKLGTDRELDSGGGGGGVGGDGDGVLADVD